MSRRIVAVLVLFLLMNFCLEPEEEASSIGDIGIIDSPQFKGPDPPAKLSLAVEMVEGAYYKLNKNGSVVNAGLLRRGFNVIPMESGRLFEMSGLHEYELELKPKGEIVSRKIEIRVRLDSENGITTPDAVPQSRPLDREYRLAMYIDGEQVASLNRKHYEKFPPKFKMPDIPQGHAAFDPTARDDPMANSFSVLGAAALAYKLIQSLTTGDKEKSSENPVKLWKQRIASFQKKDSKGISQEIKAVITIRLKE